MLRRFVTIVLLIIQIPSSSFSEIECKPIREYLGQTIFDLESVLEENIDIGLWSIIIAKEYDSTIDINYYLNKLDEMTAEINRMIADREGDMIKFLMTKMYLYDSGQWNSYQPFSYDLDDPLGRDIKKKLLSYFIDTKKGNCVSMPTLFLALMERVDPNINFKGVSAPLHLFCRLVESENGKFWNVETTNGGTSARDAWYIEQYNITQTAIDSGLYLRTLSKKEYLAQLCQILSSKYRNLGNYDKALEYNEIALRINEKSAVSLVQQGALLAWQGITLQDSLKSLGRRPTKSEFEKLKLYQVESEKYINSAMLKGWRPETSDERDIYLETIKKENNK